MSDNIVVTKNFGGNLHELRNYCNERGLADYLLGWERSGQYLVVVFRMPESVAIDNDFSY